jgi:hypothetical protein
VGMRAIVASALTQSKPQLLGRKSTFRDSSTPLGMTQDVQKCWLDFLLLDFLFSLGNQAWRWKNFRRKN